MPPRSVVAAMVATAVLIAAAPTAAAAAADDTVVVQPGDTLSELAAGAGVSTAALAAANGIQDPDRLEAGRVLVLPGPLAPVSRPYVVRRGDTLTGIAAANGVTVSVLMRANGIRNPHHIVIGTTLTIPVTTVRAAATGLPAPLTADPERQKLGPVFDHWAGVYGVPPDLAKAVAWMESGWQNHVVSVTGAMGIGQLVPATVVVARRLVGAPLDPMVAEDNIRLSVRFLRYLLDSTGDPATAVAAYYQGLASVRRDGIRAATAPYVEAVLALRARFG